MYHSTRPPLICASRAASPLRAPPVGTHTLTPGQELPELFRDKHVFTFTAVNEHFTFVRPDYIHATFFQPVQVRPPARQLASQSASQQASD
jgi:hypothetical protein